MEGEKGGEEDGPKPRKSAGKGRPGWRVFFIACLLCASKPEVDEQGQGEDKPKWRNKQKANQKEKKRKTKVNWFKSLFKSKPVPDRDSKWVWGVPMTTEEMVMFREEAQRRERACLEAYRLQQAKEEARQEAIKSIQRSCRAKEASLQILRSLPPRQEDTRPLTSNEVISNDWTMHNRERTRRKWQKLLVGMMKAQMEKDLEEVRRREMAVRRSEMAKQKQKDVEEARRRARARLASQSGQEKDEVFDLKSCREELIRLILVLAFFILPVIWIFGD